MVAAKRQPGSTFKPFMAMAALNTGKRAPTTVIQDSGTFQFGNHTFRSHGDHGLGAVDMMRSIVLSSNVYYYSLANEMGVDLIHEQLRPFGFGIKTGIDLDNEVTGVLPSTEWKRRYYKRPEQQKWYAGETISVARRSATAPEACSADWCGEPSFTACPVSVVALGGCDVRWTSSGGLAERFTLSVTTERGVICQISQATQHTAKRRTNARIRQNQSEPTCGRTTGRKFAAMVTGSGLNGPPPRFSKSCSILLIRLILPASRRGLCPRCR